jgi:hypothetical protein
MCLFGTNKPNVTRLNHKDEYYKDYYFPKNLGRGIEIVALIERVSKKQAAEMLMKADFSSYMGSMIGKQIVFDKIAREQNRKAKLTRFQIVLRGFAKERGMDISKSI